MPRTGLKAFDNSLCLPAAQDREHAIRLVWRITHLGMKLGDVVSAHLFGTTIAKLGQYGVFKQRPIECRGRRLALGLDMFRKERLCQLAKRRRPPHQGPVGRWITAMRDCPQVLFGDPAGAVRGDLANPFKRQTPCGSLAISLPARYFST